MSLFSQRSGLKPATKAIQREAIDVETRNALWSVLTEYYTLHYKSDETYGLTQYPHRRDLEALAHSYWTGYFKEASDTKPEFQEIIRYCRENFFAGSWS